ncbi:histone-lysine N-methyltransferase SETMAR [Corythoichthys intestinalis]|uniref:histone-lysine N-methyltransferase SETMAR n=1 Tax=Corythoichthys intestinalis TaxID=161448 RepID=UPI0025A500AC|nr:histone-lysine N-methyltransferase SETMAR [Corythoichthys intestinalis]XP_061813788.1 histone-lysine N-methyltransferase SETMAR-like [Nerophis lumbriciformis]
MNGTGIDLSNGREDIAVYFKPNPTEQTFPLFQYSPVNIQGPGCLVDPSEITLTGCSCLSYTCISESCGCLQTHGQSYSSNGTLVNINVSDIGHSTPVFECNALCSCSDNCSNRVVQRGLRLSLQVCMMSNRGWGVRTLQPIPCGTFVCEYAGEVISFEEARRRQIAQRFEENNYIIAVREHAGTDSVTETFVDPAMVGNIGRFLNHSCLPNLFMVPVRVHSLVPRLALFAARDIDIQEELTFDYSGGYKNQKPGQLHFTQSDAANQASRTVQRKACHCGANNCAKFLPSDVSILN